VQKKKKPPKKGGKKVNSRTQGPDDGLEKRGEEVYLRKGGGERQVGEKKKQVQSVQGLMTKEEGGGKGYPRTGRHGEKIGMDEWASLQGKTVRQCYNRKRKPTQTKREQSYMGGVKGPEKKEKKDV